MESVGSASAEECSSWLNIGSTRRCSNGGVFSKMRSRRASPSSVVWCVNEPPIVMSSCRADSLLSPSQKCYNSTWFGIDKSGPNLVRIEKWSQAAPMVSFSFCWKLSFSYHRATIRDIGKNARQHLFPNSSQAPATFPTLWAHHCFALSSSEK